jgi:hypothetical protein
MITASHIRTPRLSARKAGIFVCLFALMLLGWGCDDPKLVTDEPTLNNASNNAPDEHGLDDAGHGPDEDVELIENGLMTGNWRLAVAADQSLISDFTLFQEVDDPRLGGYFDMSVTAENDAAGVGGDIMADSTFDGETLTLKWNPTPDVPDEVYTVVATKQDDDTFTGTLDAAVYTHLSEEIVFTRYPTPPVDEQSDAGTTAGEIDAGGQGGAGGE